MSDQNLTHEQIESIIESHDVIVAPKTKSVKRVVITLSDGVKLPVLSTAEYTRIAKEQFEDEGKGTMSLLVQFGKYSVNARTFFAYAFPKLYGKYESGQQLRNELVLRRLFTLLRDEHKVNLKLSFVSDRRANAKATREAKAKIAKKQAKQKTHAGRNNQTHGVGKTREHVEIAESFAPEIQIESPLDSSVVMITE